MQRKTFNVSLASLLSASLLPASLLPAFLADTPTSAARDKITVVEARVAALNKIFEHKTVA